MKNKKLLIAVLALALVVSLMGWLWLGTQEAPVAGGKTVTVTVIHSDSTQKEFVYTTAEAYLEPLLVSEDLVQGDASEYGLMIHTVDGETASWEANRSYWAIYIGEDYATTGASEILLTDGGQYSLVYTLG